MKIEEIQENEFVLFLDSDLSFKNYSYLTEWVNILQEANEGILLFDLHWPEREWTTEHIHRAFNVSVNNSSKRNSGQVHSGVQLLRKYRDLEEYFQLVFSVLDKDPWLVTDKYYEERKGYVPTFKEIVMTKTFLVLQKKMLGAVCLGHKFMNKIFPRLTGLDETGRGP